MTNTKMTKRDHFNSILSYVADVDRDFVLHELELLDRKNTAERKPTAVQVANEGIKTAILDGMTPNTLYTVTDIQKGVPECGELSNQRVSALLRQLVESGAVVRTEDKRKAYFSLAWSSPLLGAPSGASFFGLAAHRRARPEFPL